MLDSLKIPEQLPECIDEPLKATLTPIGKTVGETISSLFSLVFWPITTISKMANGKQEYLLAKQGETKKLQLAKFKSEIEEKLKAIPEEKLIQPDHRIICDAMEKSQSALGEDDIRQLYANLIANAANSDIANQIHPSFSTIISQLSPLDAQNLEIMDMLGLCPIARFEIHDKNGKGFRIMHPEVFLSNPEQQDTAIQAVSLNSLARLQLISLDYSMSITNDDVYSDIQSYFQEYIAEAHTKTCNWEMTKGFTELTFLGRAFLAACRSPIEPISETSVEL